MQKYINKRFGFELIRMVSGKKTKECQISVYCINEKDEKYLDHYEESDSHLKQRIKEYYKK